jgi:hypothetical protein
MKKAKRLQLNRETLRGLVAPAELREAAGGLTLPITHCAQSICIQTCKFCTGKICTQ